MRAITVSALILLCATATRGDPRDFRCSRSMEVGTSKPHQSRSTIQILNDRSIDRVGGQSCGGSLVTGTAHAVSYTLPRSSYEWLMEAKGVASVFSSPRSGCSYRTEGRGTPARTVTFSSTGTVTLRLLATASKNSHSSTGLAECTFTVTSPVVNECAMKKDNCDASHATCIDTDDSFTCTCNAGFMSTNNGVTCTDNNECIAGTSTCASTAACTNTAGSFTCACNTGFLGNGATCTDVNECTAGTSTCASAAACTNTEGSFTCACNTGFLGNGMTCLDVNECTAETSNCDSVNGECTNTEGSFTCACNTGYDGNGVTCSDANECTSRSASCDSGNGACTNTAGSFTCACNTGYDGNGVTCTDANECENNLHTCDANEDCTNTAGSFACACKRGYQGEMCTDINECEGILNTCDFVGNCTNTAGSFVCHPLVDECATNVDDCDATHATCSDTDDSFSCACVAGYTSTDDGVTCTDANECADGSANCHDSAVCSDTVGSFTCACNPGYTSTDNGVTCSDVNECAAGTDSCGSGELCTNTAGSFACSPLVDECAAQEDNCDVVHATCIDTDTSFSCACNTGFTSLNDGLTCANANECADETANCHDVAVCSDTEGSFTCTCVSGYASTDRGVTCTDVDECADGTDSCGSDQQCTNRAGSFACSAYPVVDECATGTHNCDAAHATCIDADASFSCACDTGFTSPDDGVTCSDQDECSDQLDNCDARRATCTNTAGSFSCACNSGFTSTNSGVRCTDPTKKTLVASSTLAGMTLAQFDAAAQTRFRETVAKLISGKSEADVAITNTGQITLRRLLEAGVKIDYEVENFESDSDVIAAAMAIQNESPTLFSALKQDAEFSSLTGTSIHLTDLLVLEAVTRAESAAPGQTAAWGVMLLSVAVSLVCNTLRPGQPTR